MRVFHESECGLRRPIFFRTRCGRLPTISESGCGPPDPDFVRFQENVKITMPYSLEDQSWFPSCRTLWILALLSLVSINANAAQESKSKFNVVALPEHGGIHQPFVDAAKIWLQNLATDRNFPIDYRHNTDKIDDAFLSHYQLFIQLDFPPYSWTPTAMAAFVKYIEEGRGGWIAFHHSTLLGEFAGYKMWPWFSQFMGDIRFTDYIAKFATATVIVEDPSHPAMRNLGRSIVVQDEEWYTYNKSPRPNVHVLARVNEDTDSPNTSIKMGRDHPVVWTNEHFKARNIYIFMGHHPELFQNASFTTLVINFIFGAAQQ